MFIDWVLPVFVPLIPIWMVLLWAPIPSLSVAVDKVVSKLRSPLSVVKADVAWPLMVTAALAEPWILIAELALLPNASVPLDWIVVVPPVADAPVPTVTLVVPPAVLVLPTDIV